MTTTDDSWVLITGASSGFGEGLPVNMQNKVILYEKKSF